MGVGVGGDHLEGSHSHGGTQLLLSFALKQEGNGPSLVAQLVKIPWRRKWQPTPSILAWEIPWTE